MDNGVDLSLRQFGAAWRLLCGTTPGSCVATRDGLDCIFSGLPIAFFNVALPTGRGISGDALKSHGADACAWAADKGVPWLFVVTAETLQAGVNPAATLDGCGLAPVMPLTGMFARQIPPAVTIPHDLHLATPQDDTGCASLVDVNGAAYGLDLEAAKTVVGTRAFWNDHVPVLGTVGGSPATSAAVLMIDGCRYVALVATLPAHQRRGYAEAAMRRALELAADTHGEHPTVLHATEAGRPVYERMGYTAISTHTLFMEKRFLAQH